MQTVTFTDARNKLNRLIEKLDDNSEPVVILGSKGRKDAVLISKEEYDTLIENLYVSCNSAWVKSIKKGIRELDARKGKTLNPEDVLGK
jgi:antitoxin YefM